MVCKILKGGLRVETAYYGKRHELESGWQAEIVRGVTLAIALSTQLHITMTIQRHTYPVAVLLGRHCLCVFVFV